MSSIRQSRHRILGLTCALAAAVVWIVAAPAAVRANVSVCLEDEAGDPLRFVWVQHWLTDYMTDVNGCVVIHAEGELDIRVFAHNPVVRMDDGNNSTLPVSQQVRVSDGQTRQVPAQGAFWRIAEHFRHAYNHGLREFSPWNDAKFPAGTRREPDWLEYKFGRGVIRVTWPDNGPAVVAWTEGAAVTAVGWPVPSTFVGFPLVHLYAAYLAGHEYRLHAFDYRTDFR
jgi:hypothetical protein